MKHVQAFFAIAFTFALILSAYAALVWLYGQMNWVFQTATILVAVIGVCYAMTLAMLWIIKEATKND